MLTQAGNPTSMAPNPQRPRIAPSWGSVEDRPLR